MRVTKLIKTIGITINLGNYESFRQDVTVEAELEPGDEVVVSSLLLASMAQQQLWEDVQPILMNLPRYQQEQIARRLDHQGDDINSVDKA